MPRARYATDPAQSRGRLHPEPETLLRTAFARDRDRLIHSTAFRRLRYKTQVFVAPDGDHFRVRLTHSLEVAQIARTIARNLALDEDLTEVVALAHDLGHPPFGHSGEDALTSAMAPWGGFDHNGHAVRILTLLENRTPDHDGLNPSWEVLEGLAKHNGPVLQPGWALAQADAAFALELHTHAGLEAQVASLADDIAYNAHDIDDGLRAGLFGLIDLGDVPLAGEALSQVLKLYPKLEQDRVVHETVRRVMSAMVNDIITECNKNNAKHNIRSAKGVRQLGQPLIVFGKQMHEQNKALQSFLNERMYRHERVEEIMARARRVMHDLFAAYMNDPKLLPAGWQDGQARQICDFIAGMTDRYALDQHKRLFDLDPLFR
jgi:dGTPase